MPSTSSLIQQLANDFPHLTITAGDSFRWSPGERTVYYQPDHPQVAELLLHETSHGLLEHADYSSDVTLLAMEAAAWEKAATLGKEYGITIEQSVVDEHLDTYREWLHARSTCPACTATGYQTKSNEYSCPACQHTWRVNEARSCQLRRYSNETKTPLS